MGTSADVDDWQILVYYENDDIPWHHRILLARIQGTQWVWLTPDWEVQAVDLQDPEGPHLRTIRKAAPIPTECAPSYLFELPLDQIDLAAAREEAARLVEILRPEPTGAAKPAGSARWVFADTSSDRFATPVPEVVLRDPGRMVTRGPIALAQIDEDDAECWEVVERVSDAELSGWKDEKHSGPGRDPRLASGSDLASGVVVLRDQMAKFKALDRGDWPFSGPRAVVELTKSVASSGHELNTYGQYWVRHSGVNPKSAVAIELLNLMMTLHYAVAADKLDPYNSTACEHTARRVLQIQRAVRRNPQAPDFSGLEAYMMHSSDMYGTLQTAEFDKFIGDLQKSEAHVMKQNRLLKEEADAEYKKRKSGKMGAGAADG